MIRLLAIFTLFCGSAHADYTLDWQPPTERENGETLARSEIHGYTILKCVGDVCETVARPQRAERRFRIETFEERETFYIYVCDLRGLCSESVVLEPRPAVAPPTNLIIF